MFIHVVILALVCATASAASLVKVAEAHNYKALIKEHETVLIDFWAPWCDHCKNLEPEFDGAAYELESEGVVLAKMNVDNKGNRAVAQKVGVDGYPGLIVFSGGKVNKRATAHIHRIRDKDFLTHFMSKVHAGGEFPHDPEVDDTQFTKKKKAKHKKGSPSPSPKAPSPKANNDETPEIVTQSFFDQTLNQNDLVMIMFYAPWCGHCKKMKPAFAQASKRLAKDDIVLAKVDATALKDLAKAEEVSSFPTIKIYHEGVFAEEYEGGRSADDLVTFMTNFAASAGGGSEDECLGVDYCVKHYAECCTNGNWQKGEGRKPVCKQAKGKL